jgi:hypothetical protein
MGEMHVSELLEPALPPDNTDRCRNRIVGYCVRVRIERVRTSFRDAAS